MRSSSFSTKKLSLAYQRDPADIALLVVNILESNWGANGR